MPFSREKNLESILVIAVACGILSVVLHLQVAIYIGLVLMVAELVSDKLGGGIVWLWMWLAEKLGWIMSRVLLFIVYFVILTPIAFLYRLSSKDPMVLKPTKRPTLFYDRDHLFVPADLEHIW